MDSCHDSRMIRCLEKTVPIVTTTLGRYVNVMQAGICLMLGLPMGSTGSSLHFYSLLIRRTQILRYRWLAVVLEAKRGSEWLFKSSHRIHEGRSRLMEILVLFARLGLEKLKCLRHGLEDKPMPEYTHPRLCIFEAQLMPRMSCQPIDKQVHPGVGYKSKKE